MHREKASNMTSSRLKIDPRKKRTRDELLAAFFKLVLSRRYHEIRIADILSESGVSRSTFYEHFASKDELLCASIEGPFLILAGMVCNESSARHVEGLLAHFWENRALARTLFQGSAHQALRRKLIGCIESRLDNCARSKFRIPRRLVAHGLADGMFSPIVAWLLGEATCDAGDLAVALQRSAAASIETFLFGVRHERTG
jgi:AcrR family transcriptional regulator